MRRAAYHPQTDGLVEQNNATLKTTLKKLLDLETRKWEDMLPLALFAIRCKVQKSTGYSPFELLFGHQPRTLLEMVQEKWEGEPESAKPVVEYVSDLKTHLRKIRAIMRQNLEEAQAAQKTQYDRHAKARTLKIGDAVLLMMASSDHKMLGQWQGPYRVLEQVAPVTYRIETDAERGTSQIYHINL